LEWYSGCRETRDSYRIGFSGEVDFSYQMSRYFKVLTGVNYFERGYKLKDQILHDEQGWYMIGVIDATYDINSLGVPLKLEFETNGTNLFSFFVNAGINFEYRFRNHYEMEIVENWDNIDIEGQSFKIGSEQWFHPETAYVGKSFSIAGLVDLGLNLNLKNRISLSLATTAYYNFNSVLQKSIKENLYGVGLKIGVRYSFQ
jgi:hypothetical protein